MSAGPALTRLAVGQPVIYQGTEHPKLRGHTGYLLAVLSPRLLVVGFALPDGRQPVVKVPPEDVGAFQDALAL